MPNQAATILVVEDEEASRQLAAEVLAREGYEVLQACDGQDALQFFQDKATEVDLVFTDVVMPNMGGVEFTERLMKIVPQVKVLFTSGYAHNEDFERKIARQEVNFIAKPYDVRGLAGKVREVLGEKAR